MLQAIIELRKRGVYSSALIKKRRYWPKYIDGDAVRQHFDSKEVGSTDSWPGILDNHDFHMFAMKESDYVMSLMSAYGTNERITTSRQTERSWKDATTKEVVKKAYIILKLSTIISCFVTVSMTIMEKGTLQYALSMFGPPRGGPIGRFRSSSPFPKSTQI